MAKNIKRNVIRERILELLKNPMNVSQLKKELKEIKSFGTLSYHLREMKKAGLIDSRKQTKVQGQPTEYFIRNKEDNFSKMSLIQIKEFLKKRMDKDRIKILKLLNEKPRHLEELYEKFGDKGKDIIEEESGLIDVKVFITEKGRKFLKKL